MQVIAAFPIQAKSVGKNHRHRRKPEAGSSVGVTAGRLELCKILLAEFLSASSFCRWYFLSKTQVFSHLGHAEKPNTMEWK